MWSFEHNLSIQLWHAFQIVLPLTKVKSVTMSISCCAVVVLLDFHHLIENVNRLSIIGIMFLFLLFIFYIVLFIFFLSFFFLFMHVWYMIRIKIWWGLIFIFNWSMWKIIYRYRSISNQIQCNQSFLFLFFTVIFGSKCCPSDHNHYNN